MHRWRCVLGIRFVAFLWPLSVLSTRCAPSGAAHLGHQVSVNVLSDMKKFIVATILVLAVTACSQINDPTIKQGFEALELAYITKVKPENASYTKCVYSLVDSRHVVRCGISFGSPELAQKGYWEIESHNGDPIIYAMNGKALAALDRMEYSEIFKAGNGRSPLNITKIEELLK